MNRLLKIVLAAAVAVGSLAVCATASAHWRGTIWIGPGPFWWGPYYPGYYPYYYPPVVVDPVYVQPNPVVQVPAPPNYWYYCAQSNAYYPYVSECPSGWQQVAPQPPAPAATPAPR